MINNINRIPNEIEDNINPQELLTNKLEQSIGNITQSLNYEKDELTNIETILKKYLNDFNRLNLSDISEHDKIKLEENNNAIINDLNNEIIKISNNSSLTNDEKITLSSKIRDDISKIELENEKLHIDYSHNEYSQKSKEGSEIVESMMHTSHAAVLTAEHNHILETSLGAITATSLAIAPPIGLLILGISIIILRTYTTYKNNLELRELLPELNVILLFLSKNINHDITNDDEKYILYKRLYENINAIHNILITLYKIYKWRYSLFPNSFINKIVKHLTFINTEIIIINNLYDMKNISSAMVSLYTPNSSAKLTNQVEIVKTTEIKVNELYNKVRNINSKVTEGLTIEVINDLAAKDIVAFNQLYDILVQYTEENIIKATEYGNIITKSTKPSSYKIPNIKKWFKKSHLKITPTNTDNSWIPNIFTRKTNGGNKYIGKNKNTKKMKKTRKNKRKQNKK
jgi:biopolymer transport protein ExbB/TolQ